MAKAFYKAVGERIRQIRKDSGMSQDAFAAAAGMNERYVWRVEQGLQNLSLLSLGRAAFALGVVPAVFLEGIAVDDTVLERGEPRRNARAGSAAPSSGRRNRRGPADASVDDPPGDSGADVGPGHGKDKRVSAGEYFIEKRPDGRFNVAKPNAGRPSAIAATQAEAVAKARALDPAAAIHVERVRNVGPGRDKWRRV